MFKAPFSFNGRIGRLEYLLTFVIYIMLYIVLLTLIETGGSVAAIASLLMIIPMVWFLWAQGAKRCHDIGRNGWMQIVPFYFLVLLFSAGYDGENEYDGVSEDSPAGLHDTLDGHLKN